MLKPGILWHLFCLGLFVFTTIFLFPNSLSGTSLIWLDSITCFFFLRRTHERYVPPILNSWRCVSLAFKLGGQFFLGIRFLTFLGHVLLFSSDLLFYTTLLSSYIKCYCGQVWPKSFACLKYNLFFSLIPFLSPP